MFGFRKGDVTEQALSYIFLLVIGGMFLGAGAIALGAFSTSAVGNPEAVASIGNASMGLVNLAQQMPTVGTVAGVGLILAIIIGAVGVYVMNRRQ